MKWTALFMFCFVMLLAAPLRADYVYGGTEASWEWLTDASRAIVVGQVTRADDDSFALLVDQVLKRRGVAVERGQLVGGATLGHAQLRLPDALHREVGWPALSDPTTYPHAVDIRDRHWQPPFYRQDSWVRGDRCLIFYGYDLQTPLQIINLDKPITIEVPFLAIDAAGQTVTRPDALSQSISHSSTALRCRCMPSMRSPKQSTAVC